MRHRHKKSTQISTGVVKQSLVLRNMLTSLVLHGHVEVTPQKARALKAYADGFFSRLMKRNNTLDAGDARRENIREVKSIIYGEVAGKKVVDELLPKYTANKANSFVADYKAGLRAGDASTKVLITLL
jgi:ribosomal protein L17